MLHRTLLLRANCLIGFGFIPGLYPPLPQIMLFNIAWCGRGAVASFTIATLRDQVLTLLTSVAGDLNLKRVDHLTNKIELCNEKKPNLDPKHKRNSVLSLSWEVVLRRLTMRLPKQLTCKLVEICFLVF